MNHILGFAVWILRVILLVVFTSWLSGAIVVAGVFLVKNNPLAKIAQWMNSRLWKGGFVIALIFAFFGVNWH